MRNLDAFVSGQRAGSATEAGSGSSARLACDQWGVWLAPTMACDWTVLEGPLGLTARRTAPTARCRSRGPARLCRTPCSTHRAVPGWPRMLVVSGSYRILLTRCAGESTGRQLLRWRWMSNTRNRYIDGWPAAPIPVSTQTSRPPVCISGHHRVLTKLCPLRHHGSSLLRLPAAYSQCYGLHIFTSKTPGSQGYLRIRVRHIHVCYLLSRHGSVLHLRIRRVYVNCR